MEAKVRLINSQGTPITNVRGDLLAEYLGYNRKDPSKIVRVPFEEQTVFEDGQADLEYPPIEDILMDVVETLRIGIGIEDERSFYQTSVVTYKVSKECTPNSKYVDYGPQIQKERQELQRLNDLLKAEEGKKEPDPAIIKDLKDQIDQVDGRIRDLEKAQKEQSDAGIYPTICEIAGNPQKVSIPLKQMTRTPEQEEKRITNINSIIISSAVNKVNKVKK